MIIKNPVFSDEIGQIRDPMIIFDSGKYYMTGTSPDFWQGESGGVKLWSSDNLQDWKFEKTIIDPKTIADDKPYKDRFWAPELFFDGKKYYCVFNAQNEKTSVNYNGMRSFVAVSDRIDGDYVIYEKPLINNIGMTNDAHLFKDEDGKVYLFYTDGEEKSIKMVEFSTDSCTIIGEPRIVISSGKEDEWDSIGIEGSFVVKRNGIYYHWYSSWTRSYEMGLATTDDLNKPFVKCSINPIVSCYEKEQDKFCGHNSCFKLKDGRDAIAFHMNSSQYPPSLCINAVEYPFKASMVPCDTLELEE